MTKSACMWLGVVLALASAGAAAQTGTVPLDSGTPPTGLTNSNITEVNGNVGIGTTSPGYPLEISTSSNQQSLGITNGGATAYGGYIGQRLVAANSRQGLIVSGTGSLTLNAQSFNIDFITGAITPTTDTNLAMRIAAGGNVGIGTTAPGAKLEVSGGIKLSSGSGGTITFQDGSVQTVAYTGVTCGGDYAESVDVTGDRTAYEPGDVLVLDADNPGKMLKSIEAYSTSVSGIYSTKPGTVGRRQTTPKSLDEVPMAVVGIVPAKVSTENGPIKVGDLLVTSSIPGYAMKGTDRSRMLGAIVGKAMAKLDSGTGIIEVLVTLQ